MPLKRIFASNEGKRLHQRAGSGLFSYAGGLPEQKPKGSPREAPNSSQEPPRNAAQFAHLLPLKFKNTFTFALLRYPKIPTKHQRPSKNNEVLPLFSPFCPHSGLSGCSGPAGVVPMLLAYQDREEGRNGSPVAPVAGGPDAPEGIEAGPRNGSPPPPNKTRNTTGPAAPMGSGAPDAVSQ